jgi:hypothetical protein|tara:strand:- start:1790 stop:1966 length:177 start_codon:yes stop_codon:yes gene_type:complete
MMKKKNVVKKMGGGPMKKKNVVKKRGGGMMKKRGGGMINKMRGGGSAGANPRKARRGM